MTGLSTDTPVEEITDPLFIEKKVRVFIKRDDTIHPFISGNKWRKLKYDLAGAKSLGKDHIVTFGGAFSNHLLAAACAAAKYSFRSTGFVRGEAVNNPVLSLCRLFGMELHFIDRTRYRAKRDLFDENFAGEPTAYFIDEGGAGPNGVRGCAELVDELTGPYDHIFCAGGTGTTAAGIISGIEARDLQTQFHLVPALKGGDFLGDEIRKYTDHPFLIHREYHFGGYAKTSDDLLRFISSFTQRTGILIEPVYTGKMFYALYDLIAKNTFKPREKILAIHTGGLTGILGMLERFER